VRLNLLSDNVINPDEEVDLDDVDFESNAELHGVVYAPNAHVEIDSNFQLFGSLVARSVRLSSWSRIHFDEALREVDGDESESGFTRLTWRERPVSAAEIQW